jgi:hypothetical protein
MRGSGRNRYVRLAVADQDDTLGARVFNSGLHALVVTGWGRFGRYLHASFLEIRFRLGDILS